MLQLAIKEASTIRVRVESVKIERDVFVYRSYIGVGNFAVVLDEIKDTKATPVDLVAVKLLATYLSNPDAKETAVVAAHQLLEDSASGEVDIGISFVVRLLMAVCPPPPPAAGNITAQLMAATIFLHEENYADALKAVRSGADLQQYANCPPFSRQHLALSSDSSSPRFRNPYPPGLP